MIRSRKKQKRIAIEKEIKSFKEFVKALNRFKIQCDSRERLKTMSLGRKIRQ